MVELVRAAEADYLATINAELHLMSTEEQSSRRQGAMNWHEDAARRKRAVELIDEGALVVADDFYRAAMIFQHGSAPEDFELAHELALTAIDLDPSNADAKWLVAASKDRHLHSLGKPQVYGTQFRRDGNGPWTLEPIDETAVTDEEREEFGVPPLAAAKERVKAMNARTGGRR